MRNKRIITCAVLFGAAWFSTFNTQLSTLKADDNVGALWTEVGVTKVLPYNLSVEASLEHRTENWFDESGRWSAGAGMGYKVNKYLKLGLGYTFIDRHYQQEWKKHYNETGAWNGYNVDEAHWRQRHRVALDVTGTYKLWKTLRVSLRERYQYTHHASCDVDRTKLRKPKSGVTEDYTEWDGYSKKTYTTDHKYHKNKNLLRSRLKLSIDKKRWKWEPYVSAELHNNLDDKMHIDKVRLTVGTEYNITKQHQVGLGYLFNHENDDDGDQNIHAIEIGYNFKF